MNNDFNEAGRHLSAALKSEYDAEVLPHLQQAIEHLEAALKLAKAALADIQARYLH